MAGLAAIHAVTSGLAQYLTRAHQVSPISATSCAFLSVGTAEFQSLDSDHTTCSLFVYRVSQNEHTRNQPNRGDARKPALTVNLHMMLTIWAESAQKEQLVFAWVLRELTRLALIDRGVLGTTAGFDPRDLIQLAFEDFTLEESTKLWQVLVPPYRLSTTFVARNVRIDYEDTELFAPVVATRFGVSDQLEPA